MDILQEMGPPELRARLFLNPQKCTIDAVVRSEAMSFMEAKVGARPYKDEPMDLKSLAKGQDKGKEKGKDSKATGKDKGTEQHDSTVKFEEYRSNSNSS